jgi:exopolyphosphatase/guanosine-5'-triphosphate,3'-diphosphate pyrophosphatase
MAIVPETRRVGVIDIGSNSATLALFGLNHRGGLRAVAEHSQPLRLLTHLDDEGRLPPRGIAATVKLLREFLAEAHDRGVTTVHLIATSALRDAANRDEVVARVKAELGVTLRVIDGEEEGRSAARAAVQHLPIESGFVADLGGGSLQIVEIRDRRSARVESLPLGALRLARRYVTDDPPDPAAITAMRRVVQEALAGVPWFRAEAGTLVGLGGTIRALAKIDRRARRSILPHTDGYRLSADAVEAIWERVSRLPVRERLRIPGLPAQRADLVVPGALVVSWLMRVGGFSALHVSPVGVREGVALGVDTEPPAVDAVREAALLTAFPLTGRDLDRANARRDAALLVFDALAPLGRLAPEHRALVATAAWLSERGPAAAGTLLTAPIAGFWQDDLLGVADLLSPVARGGLHPETHTRLAIVLELAHAEPERLELLGPDGMRVVTRRSVPADLGLRFREAFGRALVQARSAAMVMERP